MRRLFYFACLVWLLLVATSCMSQGMSRTTERTRPDGSTERTTWRLHSQSMSWQEIKGVGGMLLSSDLGQMVLAGMGGTGLLGALGAWLATRARAERRVRAEADKAYDEGAARAKETA
jgi:hypothetical protein